VKERKRREKKKATFSAFLSARAPQDEEIRKRGRGRFPSATSSTPKKGGGGGEERGGVQAHSRFPPHSEREQKGDEGKKKILSPSMRFLRPQVGNKKRNFFPPPSPIRKVSGGGERKEILSSFLSPPYDVFVYI